MPLTAPLLLCVVLAIPQGTSGTPDLDQLPKATAVLNEEAGELVIELSRIAVPAGGMVRVPVHRVEIPVEVVVYRYRVELVDDHGALLPADRLHHFNLTDLDRRELFAPLPLHVIAASKETGTPSVPKELVGMPLPVGTRYIAGAMIANPDHQDAHWRARLVFDYVPAGRLLPVLRAYPWVMDVRFPLGGEGGRKDFDLPPGKSSWSWVSQPAIPGTIIGLGGHLHDYATLLEFEDVTTGAVIWRQQPQRDAEGRVTFLPPALLSRWYRLGAHIEPLHRYRVTVHYDNPTGTPIPFGGMGAVGGLFRPDNGAAWPRVDPQSPVYLADLGNKLRNMAGMQMTGHDHHEHGPPEDPTSPRPR